jgi:hypothetical protein
MASIASACGRQVTPNPPGIGAGGLSSGYFSVKFDVQQQFNFSNYSYIIVFNTTGNGLTPLPNGYTNNWKAYSFAIIVGGTFGGGTQAQICQYVHQQTQNPAFICLNGIPPQLLQYTPNSNGTGTEFTVIFSRSIFAGIVTGSPSPSPTPSPGQTALPYATNWTVNAFTGPANYGSSTANLYDSLGSGGGADTTFVSPVLNVTQSFDQTIYAQIGTLPPDPSAQIASIEVANNP